MIPDKNDEYSLVKHFSTSREEVHLLSFPILLLGFDFYKDSCASFKWKSMRDIHVLPKTCTDTMIQIVLHKIGHKVVRKKRNKLVYFKPVSLFFGGPEFKCVAPHCSFAGMSLCLTMEKRPSRHVNLNRFTLTPLGALSNLLFTRTTSINTIYIIRYVFPDIQCALYRN